MHGPGARLGVQEGPIWSQEEGAENGLLCAQTHSGSTGSPTGFTGMAVLGDWGRGGGPVYTPPRYLGQGLAEPWGAPHPHPL